MSPPAARNYYIKNKASGYYVTLDGKDSFTTAVHTTKPDSDLDDKFVFRILDAGPGLYNIRLLGENRFWYDDVVSMQPCCTILLNTGRTGDACNGCSKLFRFIKLLMQHFIVISWEIGFNSHHCAS
ncbi:hypothetical protein GYMLUDRAFT_50380 [Collybiopsis luxurians FD-317 M1]|uniref:Uncharacterized protein n=1 Tax=Collybiopsis luxurians FD-317 M1 TaxID=944289 RepID=A0A0D0CA55_9AGAR|nr:hypothetical protein GYMLUDRAFT_50380 [Collybiopsis luxurians FD-317 M1]